MDIQEMRKTSNMAGSGCVFSNLSEFLSNDALLMAYNLVQSPIALITSEAETKLVNTKFEQFFSSIASSDVNLFKLDFLNEAQKEEFKKLLLKFTDFTFTFHLVSRDGATYLFTAKASHIQFSEPKACCYVITFEHRILREQAFNSTNANLDFKLVFENLPQPLIIYTCDSIIVSANLAACNFLGYPNEELVGLKVENIIKKSFASEAESQVAQVRQSKELLFSPIVLTKSGKSVSVDPKSFVLRLATTTMLATLFRELEDDTDNRKQLINAIVDTEINERKRFAKDLHDGLGPLLSAIKLYVNELKDSKIKVKDRNELLKFISQLIDDAIQNARETANSLMPTVIKNYGLISAVNSFVSKINYLNKYNIKFTVDPPSFNLDNTLETSFYRIVKELVNNTIKHANAKNIDIILTLKDNVLSLAYSDDGVGFDFEQIQKSHSSGLGLSNMINRVHLLSGEINFDTSKGKGFMLSIKIDLDKMFANKT